MQEYEKNVEEMKIEMDKKLSYHEKNPENHPFYPDEWKKFWNRRFKELQIEGKDPNTYDFKPEWILSWSKRLHEFHEEEINEKMEKLKNKMLIDMDRSSSESPPKESSPLKDKKHITDFKNFKKSHIATEVIDRETEKVTKLSADKKIKVAGASPIDSDSEDSADEITDENKPKEKIQIENPLNVITVLRQLSVLESQLGLLAPKIVDLLSKGLVMEKIEPKSSIKLLTPENCVMFETVKEKLKGQLLAAVVKKTLVNATMFSIRNIEKLMQIAPKFVPTSSMLGSTSSPIPIAVPGVGVIDKMAIAQQITQALLAQGKVDVTQEELETLINAVVGMAQAGTNVQSAKNLLDNINNAKNGDVLKPVNDEGNKKKEKKEEVEKKNLDQLSQGDIINLLKNFSDLNTDEQDGLITYLRDLGEKNPEEVKKFRKYMDMGPSNLQEITYIFKDEDDDDNYELSDVCKSIKEKVSEQKDESLNKMTVNFEITEEQKKLLNSIQHYLPKINSDYSLQPTNPETLENDQSFYKNTKNEPCTSAYSPDPYSAQKSDPNIYPLLPSTSVPYLNTQEQLKKYNVPQEQSNKYCVPQEQTNKYNTPQDLPNKYSAPQELLNKYSAPQELPIKYNTSEEQPIKYNTSEEKHNNYNSSQEKPDPYSANQLSDYNDPYSHNNRNKNYFKGQQQDSYYQYQQKSSNYPSEGYYKNDTSYKSNNTYPNTYQGTSKENDRTSRYNHSNNNRFQGRR